MVFFTVDLPFYVLAWMRMGPRFTVKSFVAVGLVSAMTWVMPGYLSSETLHPTLAALLAGAT